MGRVAAVADTHNGFGVTATCHHAEVQGSLPLSMMVESARYKDGLGIDKTWVHISYISSLYLLAWSHSAGVPHLPGWEESGSGRLSKNGPWNHVLTLRLCSSQPGRNQSRRAVCICCSKNNEKYMRVAIRSEGV